MRRVALLGFLAFIFLTGTAYGQTVRFGVLQVLDALPLQVATAEGLFAQEGLDVELIPFMSALERDTAMQSGQLDGFFGDLLAALLLMETGVPIRVVNVSYATTVGQPMFAVVLGPGKKAEGKLSIGLSTATIIEYLLDGMTGLPAMQGIEQERVEVKKMPIRMQMLLAGQLDAALLPEPLASMAESKGGGILVTDEKLDMPLTVLCLHENQLDRRRAFLKAYGKALDLLEKNPGKYKDLMIEACRMPAPLVDKFIGYRFPEIALPTENDLFRVQQWMLTRGMLSTLRSRDKIVAE